MNILNTNTNTITRWVLLIALAIAPMIAVAHGGLEHVKGTVAKVSPAGDGDVPRGSDLQEAGIFATTQCHQPEPVGFFVAARPLLFSTPLRNCSTRIRGQGSGVRGQKRH